MGYSKMVSVEVFNFMAFKHAKACFDERGIINLKGYNNSGKSAMNRAIAVCLMNMYTRIQGKFIHHGEDYFRVIISFDDGVSIIKDKYINGQSLYELHKDGECLFTTKQGNKLTKVDGVPSVIKDYLALVETDLGYLNFQTRKDPLWLVETKGGENYYSLNEILKTEEIARANALLNSDINELNGNIASIESNLHAREMQYLGYQHINEYLVVVLSEKEAEMQNLMSRSRAIQKIESLVDELSEIKEIPSISNINTDKLLTVGKLNKTMEDLGSIKLPPELNTISSEELNAFTSIKSTLNQLDTVNTSILPIECQSIDISKLPSLSTIQKELKNLSESVVALNNLSKQELSLKEEKDGILQEAENSGIKFVTCDNCGTLMEVRR